MIMSKNLLIRSISGLVLVAIIVISLWWNCYTRFFILSLIGLAGCLEFSLIFRNKGVNISIPFVFLATVTLILAAFFKITLTIPIAALFLIRAIFELYRQNKKPIESISYEFLAILYTVLPMLLLAKFDLSIIFAVLIFVWVNDVGAYLVGSMIGKRTLFKRLSPKKSWEGFFGGFILALVAGYLYGEITGVFNPVYGVILAGGISLAAVFGDLFESMIKRSINIKDSGRIIPGHGGVLDRFDALYFAAFALYVIDEITKIL